MNKKEFSRKILNSSVTHWNYTLKGERNLGYQKAKIVSALFGTSIEVWLDPDRKVERQEAWKKFQRGEA